jgi:hypothetical protein
VLWGHNARLTKENSALKKQLAGGEECGVAGERADRSRLCDFAVTLRGHSFTPALTASQKKHVAFVGGQAHNLG